MEKISSDKVEQQVFEPIVLEYLYDGMDMKTYIEEQERPSRETTDWPVEPI
jgi:hypothetical protein